MSSFIILSILFCLIGNSSSQLKCGWDVKDEADCLRKLSFYKKAFFTDQYGNTKEKISFSDYLNHYKSAGYEFPKAAIETEAEKFYRHANGGGYETKTCWGCGNGDGHMNLQEMLRKETSANRDMYACIINYSYKEARSLELSNFVTGTIMGKGFAKTHVHTNHPFTSF